MTIHVITKTKGYEIYVNNELFINTDNPVTTYNEVIRQTFGENVDVTVSGNGFRNTVKVSDISESFNNFNSRVELISDTISVDEPVFVKSTTIDESQIDFKLFQSEFQPNNYRETFSDYDEDYDEDDYWEDEEELEPVVIPEFGELIYVDAVDGMFRKISGGVAIFNGYIETTDEQIMIETQNHPGVYYNWTELFYQQSRLKQEFGSRPSLKF